MLQYECNLTIVEDGSNPYDWIDSQLNIYMLIIHDPMNITHNIHVNGAETCVMCPDTFIYIPQL